MPQQGKKEESERLRGESDQIKFIDLGLMELFSSAEVKVVFQVLDHLHNSECCRKTTLSL